jgi:hypothetical protein
MFAFLPRAVALTEEQFKEESAKRGVVR